MHRACELDEELPGTPPPVAGEDRPGRASLMAIAAARLALEDAGLDSPLPEAGVAVGTTGGEIQVLEHMNVARNDGRGAEVSAGEFPKHPCHVIAANVAGAFGMHGPNVVVPTACAAGNYAVSIARAWVRTGQTDVALAGGCDPLSKVAFTGFARLGAISPDYCRPFDLERRGLLIGEGAGMVVVESLESARKRGAHVYAEVSGAGFSCDAHHMTMPQPDGRGVRLAMKRALADAGIAPDAIDYVSAHGTGTKAQRPDRVGGHPLDLRRGRPGAGELDQVDDRPHHGRRAAPSRPSPAASPSERGEIPPTIHHETPDPECEVDVVPNEARRHRVDVAVNNAFAFGGNNSCLVLTRPA